MKMRRVRTGYGHEQSDLVACSGAKLKTKTGAKLLFSVWRQNFVLFSWVQAWILAFLCCPVTDFARIVGPSRQSNKIIIINNFLDYLFAFGCVGR
jgi:hypothetical protein